MKIDQERLEAAVAAGIITPAQGQELWQFWQNDAEAVFQGEDGSSRLSQFLYYLGALIVIGAMGWLMNTAWGAFAGAGLLVIALAYAAVFGAAAYWVRRKSFVLSGLFVVMMVSMTPLAVFGLQKWLGIWPHAYPGEYRDFYRYIRGGWFTMEIATLAAGALALRFSRIPFAMAPLAFVLWFISMDIAPLILAQPNWEGRVHISLVVGLIMLAAALLFDRRARVDYAKWLYIFGMITFWTSLSLLNTGSELSKFFYALLNVFIMLSGVLLERKIFLVCGGLGFFSYLGYLSWSVFKDSVLFPFVLTALGLSVVYCGWVYHRKQAAIVRIVHELTPPVLLRLLPRNRKRG